MIRIPIRYIPERIILQRVSDNTYEIFDLDNRTRPAIQRALESSTVTVLAYIYCENALNYLLEKTNVDILDQL